MPIFRSQTGRKVPVTQEEFDSLKAALQRRKTTESRRDFFESSVREFVLFRAQGFAYPKLEEGAQYLTAGKFYSNKVLGKAIFPAGTSLSHLHNLLSFSLNDRHIKTGEIGDWRKTHAPGKGQNGDWEFNYQSAIQISSPVSGSRKPDKRFIPIETVAESA